MRRSAHLAAVLSLTLLLTGAATAAPAVAGAETPASLAFGPNSDPYGTSMVTWSQRWWRWETSIGTARNPSLDTTGANCDVQQQGRVWFLGSIFGSGSLTRSCTVPRDKALLVNLSGILNDYPCPDPNFKPAPGESLEHFLRHGARSVVDTVNALNLRVDDQVLPNPFAYRFTSPLFHFTGVPSLRTSIDGCITGEDQRAVSDGYYVILRPLDPGRHNVVFTARDTHGTATKVTYHLSVR